MASSDGAAAAGDGDDLAGKTLLDAAAELGLFERPVFHVEMLGLADRLESADALGVQHGSIQALRDIGGDARLLRALARRRPCRSRERRTRGARGRAAS